MAILGTIINIILVISAVYSCIYTYRYFIKIKDRLDTATKGMLILILLNGIIIGLTIIISVLFIYKYTLR